MKKRKKHRRYRGQDHCDCGGEFQKVSFVPDTRSPTNAKVNFRHMNTEVDPRDFGIHKCLKCGAEYREKRKGLHHGKTKGKT